jgi:hypothetical protein
MGTTVLGLLAVPSVALTHPTTSFDACAKEVTVNVYPCTDKAEAGPGSNMMLKAVVTPRHAKSRATVWALRPHAAEWHKAGFALVRLGGRTRYYWGPDESDVYNNTSWRFRFALPGHGHSDTVKVRVRSADF